MMVSFLERKSPQTRHGSRVVVFLIASAVTVSGCQTTGMTKQDIGTATGAVVGAVLGSRVAKDDQSKGLGMVVGAMIGGFIGSKIGKYLDEQDRLKLERATQTAMVRGKSSSWRNPDTGVVGKVSVTEESRKVTKNSVPVYQDRIAEVPPLELIGEKYSVNKGANVRSGPGTNYKVVETINQGADVDVIGRVKGQPWYLVADSGVGKGFVYSSLLRSTGTAYETGEGGAGQNARVASVDVETVQTCRTIEQDVTTGDGKKLTNTVHACQGPDGGWQVS